MAKCCVVFSQSPFEDLTAFRVRHVLLLVSILTSNAPGQCEWDRRSGFPGVTGLSNSKTLKTQQWEHFKQNTYSDPACPIVRALRSAHFAIYINATRIVITVITALLLQGRNMAVVAFQITCPSTGSGNGFSPNHMNQWDIHTLSLETSWCFQSPVVRLFVQ